jgi:hypothetical protein
MRAMDTDRFVSDLNGEKDRNPVSSATLRRRETDCAVCWVRNAVCWVGNYDTYIERQKLRTYLPEAASEECPSLKTVHHKVTFNRLDCAVYASKILVLIHR